MSAYELLSIWESSIHLSPIERSLCLLAVLYKTDKETMANLSIGERDARLLKFREWIFGSRMINIAHCPACNELVEWETSVNDILLNNPEAGKDKKILKLESGKYKIEFRLPTSQDIINATQRNDGYVDLSAVIASCVLHTDKDKQPMHPEELSTSILEAIEKQMSDADPQADIRMVLDCPECNHHWAATFDILSYLWMEIDNWAKRILKEIATLARAFGWTEKEILNLSPQRRQYYLEMVTA